MRRFERILSILIVGLSTALIASSCANESATSGDWRPTALAPQIASDVICVEPVEALPSDFILGMDASCVPALEAAGVCYYDHDGKEKDVFLILRENGINYIRVRVWNDPFDTEGNGYGGGNCDINNAIEIGKRATKAGMKLLIDFHYSDFWADPGKQMPPKAWQGMTIEEKEKALYHYTEKCLKTLLKAGVDVGMVQIGNETNGKFCGESTWQNITRLMSAGASAVRKLCPKALVAVHFANPEKPGTYALYGKKLQQYNVDYDVFASSYYPFWHGTQENLSAVLSDIAKTYGKKVMIAETSYAFTTANTDFHNNTIGNDSKPCEDYPFSMEGQATFMRDLIDTVANRTTNGIGVFYWEGTWISVGGESYAKNQSLWETYGAGWASSFAAEYDPDDAGRWHGGCAVENQAFFDEHGKATEALKIFGLVQNNQNGR